MRIILKESQLNRIKLLIENDMTIYFNMVINELKTYIVKLNTIYDNFNDYTVMGVVNMDYNEIRALHDSFDTNAKNISDILSNHDDKMDRLDWDAYREQRSIIDKMNNSIRPKENMLNDIFYALRSLSDIKDNYEDNPFGGINTINIG